MVVIVLFLVMAILSKANKTYKDIIVSNVYEKNVSFAKIKKLYDKYLGGVVPLDKAIEKEMTVFNEELSYEESSTYYDGVKLTVSNNYLVPTQSEGMIVFLDRIFTYNDCVNQDWEGYHAQIYSKIALDMKLRMTLC